MCLAFAQALARYGVPEEVITDNGKQFTDRFAAGPTRGEVLFDKICRNNGITHRLTAPASPNQNGKVERFHGTFRPDFLDERRPVHQSLEPAQAAVDAWVEDYNTDRPHQALDEKVPVMPGRPVHARARPSRAGWCELWLPPALRAPCHRRAAPTLSSSRVEPAPADGRAGWRRSSSTRSCRRRGT